MRSCDGTSAGYMRHRRAGETPCADCKRAWRLRQAEYRRRKDVTPESPGRAALRRAEDRIRDDVAPEETP